MYNNKEYKEYQILLIIKYLSKKYYMLAIIKYFFER
jgi:hypothetical protein